MPIKKKDIDEDKILIKDMIMISLSIRFLLIFIGVPSRIPE